MKKILSVLFFVVVLVGCTTSGGRLDRAVSEFNATLPQAYGSGLTCTELVVEDSVVVFNILADERKRQASLSWEENEIREQMEATMEELRRSNSPADIDAIKGYRIFVECDKGIAFEYTGQDSKYKFRITIPYEKLKKQVGY